MEAQESEISTLQQQLEVYKRADLSLTVPDVQYVIKPEVPTNWADVTVEYEQRVFKKQISAFAPHQTLDGECGTGGKVKSNSTCAKQQYAGCINSWGTVEALNSDMTGVRLAFVNYSCVD